MILNGQSYICKRDRVQRRLIKRDELERIAEWIIKREEALKTFIKALRSTNNLDYILTKFKEKGIQRILSSYM
jgi:hypothetical protein